MEATYYEVDIPNFVAVDTTTPYESSGVPAPAAFRVRNASDQMGRAAALVGI